MAAAAIPKNTDPESTSAERGLKNRKAATAKDPNTLRAHRPHLRKLLFSALMMAPSFERHTAAAHIVRVRPDLVEVRYRSGITLSKEDLSEVQRTRRELMAGQQCGLLIVLPPELDFQLAVMNNDYLAEDRRTGAVRAVAVVVGSRMFEMLVKLHVEYFAPGFPFHITHDEGAARTWLDEQLG